MNDHERAARLSQWLDSVSGEDDTLEISLRRTVVPAHHRAARAGQALTLLRELERESPPRVRMLRMLGRGGMGLIRLAEQVALGREVAVKTLRADKKSRQATLELLREAWVTGCLEHPNVAPIYDLGVDEDGSPMIVLKRIEGVTWAELIDDPDRVASAFGADDLMAWNLGILSQVLNAVRFAHSRGIIHRDLKPANVMIGEFGEVYLLDWGIAVSLHDDPQGRLPLAAEASEMAGTPGYMAPEMLGGAPEQLSERTDVYLAGAILYQILVGTPPHIGQSADEVIASVRDSPPDLPVACPLELARICQRATDPDPNGRFESAEQLRLALQGYLQHRGSVQLAARTEARLTELLALLDDPSSDPTFRQRVYDLYGACRFGFRESLAGWRRNRRADAGLRRASEAMVEYELAHGNTASAAALLDEISEPPLALRDRIARAREVEGREVARIAELERLSRDYDMRVGQRTRVFLGAVLGFALMVVPVFGILHGRDRYFSTYPYLLGWSGAFLAFTTSLAVWARESLMASAINRRLLAALMLLLLSQKVLLVGMWIADVPPVTGSVISMFLWFFTLGMMSVTVDARLSPTSLGWLLAFMVSIYEPTFRFHAMFVGTVVLVVNVAVVWWPPPRVKQPDPHAPGA